MCWRRGRRLWPEPCDWIEPYARRYRNLLGSGGVPLGWFMGLAWFESRGNPNAVNTRTHSDIWQQACGVYQHLPRYWSAMSQLDVHTVPWLRPMRFERTVAALADAGWSPDWVDRASYPLPVGPGHGILHPEANIAVACWLLGGAGPSAWAPAADEWRLLDYVDTKTYWVQDVHGQWLVRRP